MFGLAGLKFKIMVGLMLSSFVVAGWFYIQHLRSEIKAAEVREIQFQEIIAAKNAEVDLIKKDITRIYEAQGKLSTELKRAQSNVVELEKRFTQTKSGAERDLAEDAIAKPALIERAINNGTREALRCNEIATGSPLTPDELQGKVKNSICPDLLPGKVK
jgi:phage shock protein A